MLKRLVRRAVGAITIVLFASAACCAAPLIRAGQHLTLKEVIRITLINHPRHAEMKAQAGAAAEMVGQAKSNLLPQLYGAGEYLRTTANGIGNTNYLNPGWVPRLTGRNHDLAPDDFSQSTETQDNFLAGVGADQYLFDFGRVRGYVAQREDEAKAADARLRMTDLDLIFTASERYFALLTAKAQAHVFREAIRQRKEELHDSQVRAAAGLVPTIDVYTAQSALARANVHLIDAQDQIFKGKAALDNAMGVGPQAPDYTIDQVLKYSRVTGDAQRYFAIALQDRPDLQMVEDQARAAGAEIREFKSDYFPRGDLVAGYNALGTGLPAANNFDVGVVISWPIFNGFLTRDQVAQARLRRHAIEAAIRDLRQKIYLQVASAFLDWRASVQRIHQAQATLAASSVQLELAQKRYQTGLGNIIELTDADRFYIQDKAAYVDALFRYSVAKASLDRADASALAVRY